MEENLRASYIESLKTLSGFIDDGVNIEKTDAASKAIARAFQNGCKVIAAGNGGSACDAMHFAEEFTGKFRADRKPLPVIALTDPAHITAVGNDFGFSEVFSRGIEAYGRKGDIFIGISTSGNSQNIVSAVDKCRTCGISTIGLLGRDGGKLKGLCDFEFIVPGHTSDRIQEVHMTILHILIEGTERILFPENYSA